MLKIDLAGSYYEMGREFGKTLKKIGVVPEEVEKNSPRAQMAQECDKIIQEYTPGVIEYLKGIAEGGDYNYDEIKMVPMLLMYGTPPPPSCTVCFVSSQYSASERPIMFRNYDFNLEFERYLTQRHTKPTGGYESYSFCDIWAGAYGGINEKGLVMAITSASAYNGDWKPGISMNLLTQWILDHYENAKDAAEFLKTVPHLGGFHYFIADKQSNIARVLGTPKSVGVELFHDKNIIQTNHFLVDSMRHLENPALIATSSRPRYTHVDAWLQDMKAKIDAEKIEAFCRLPIPEGGIYELDEFQGMKFGTLWSWYYDFGKREFFVSDGNPRNHSYQKINFGNVK